MDFALILRRRRDNRLEGKVMSSSSVSPLSSGVQDLYNSGLLASSVSTNLLSSSSAGQLNQLASSSIALAQIGTLLDFGTASNDSATLSSTATDALAQAVNNELTSSLDAAVSKFLPQTSSSSESSGGSNINLVA
jgi:hypothetical protein